MAALTWVLLGATSLSVVLGVAQGAWWQALGNGVVMLVSAGTLLALKRGVSLLVVAPVLLGVGLIDAAFNTISTGLSGSLSVVWLTMAPVIALSVGGRKAGWLTLGPTLLAIGVTLLGCDQHWLSGIVSVERTFASRTLTILAFCLVVFLLTRAYELETEAAIGQLEVHNETLQVARAQAESGSRAKSEFLASMSHELRTPLNGVTSMALLLHDEPNPDKLREGLRVIERSAEMLLAVINDVLDFSKIESNQLELEAIPLSVAAEVRAVVSIIAPTAARQGTALELRVEPTTPAWIQGDPTRLRQIATNLLANAVKFTEGGRVTCWLRGDGHTVTLEVADTGIGMTKETLSRLFKPFAQADSSTTRRFGGSGLGLVITRRLLEAMRGTVTATSEPGRGSVFTARFSFVEVDEPVAAVVELVQPSISGPLEILVAEDNPINQLVITRLLEKLGHRTLPVSNGEEAIVACQRQAFDLVLMDCHMPVLDGFEATQRLRRAGMTVPVYAVTAAVSKEDQATCLASGMNGLLGKPIRIKQLKAVLTDALARREQRVRLSGAPLSARSSPE